MRHFRVQSSLDFTLGRLQSARAVRGQKEQVLGTTLEEKVFFRGFPLKWATFCLILQSFSWLSQLGSVVEIRFWKFIVNRFKIQLPSTSSFHNFEQKTDDISHSFSKQPLNIKSNLQLLLTFTSESQLVKNLNKLHFTITQSLQYDKKYYLF